MRTSQQKKGQPTDRPTNHWIIISMTASLALPQPLTHANPNQRTRVKGAKA